MYLTSNLMKEKTKRKQLQPELDLSQSVFYRPYRGERPVWLNNHAEAVMRGMG